MNTWILLEKELNYYGIRLISNKKCQPLIIDGRRILNKDDYKKYEGIGLIYGNKRKKF